MSSDNKYFKKRQYLASLGEYESRYQYDNRVIRHRINVALGCIAVAGMGYMGYEIYETNITIAQEESAVRQLSKIAIADGFELKDDFDFKSSLDSTITRLESNIEISDTCTLNGVTIHILKDESATDGQPKITDITSYSIPLQAGTLTFTDKEQLTELTGENPCVTLSRPSR